MIDHSEIEAKSREFGIDPANVQRDYVFSWLVGTLFTNTSPLKDQLALKGGNALRKAYFPSTRFSDDLDFTTAGSIQEDRLVPTFNELCKFIQEKTDIEFRLDENKLADVHEISGDKRVYKLRLYFKDFSGKPGEIILKVRVDVTEFDRTQLPIQTRNLIHQYSDSDDLRFQVKAVKLEEALADKLKCLLQRQYAYDLYDLVYGIFVNNELAVDKGEVVKTFLAKTIFEPSPQAAKELLLGTPLSLVSGFWNRIIVPKAAQITFDSAVKTFQSGIETLFQPFSYGASMAGAYYPSTLRNKILQAGSSMTLMQITYDNEVREIEPYSLIFKRRKDGSAREYFYAWDRTGGTSRKQGIKMFVQEKVESLENTDTKFDPQFDVELSKAGDKETSGYFSRPFSTAARTPRLVRRSSFLGLRYRVQCPYCNRSFVARGSSTALPPHNDRYRNRCFGRVGILVV